MKYNYYSPGTSYGFRCFECLAELQGLRLYVSKPCPAICEKCIEYLESNDPDWAIGINVVQLHTLEELEYVSDLIDYFYHPDYKKNRTTKTTLLKIFNSIKQKWKEKQNEMEISSKL